MREVFRTGLRATAASAALAAGMSGALAGGFINQSQSTVGNGMAYAGWGAMGGDPSSMFINPATMAQFPYFTTSTNLFGIAPYSNIRGVGNTAAPPNNAIPSGDIGQDAFSTASYYIVPLSPSVNMGLAINSPFGFTTSPNTPWGGQNVSETTTLKTITFSPALSYAYSNTLAFGLGMQIQWAKARLVSNALPPPGGGPLVGLKGEGMGFGVTAGVTWQPWAGTSIGLGYRSRINQEIDGHFIGFCPLTPACAALNAFGNRAAGFIKMPDRVNLSVRHAINPQLDILGTIEWQGWSRIGTSRINAPVMVVAGFPLRALPFEYKDGWFFSTGVEYKYSQNLTLRGGIAYEISPVSDRVRSTRLTDNDRFWTSLGLSYKWSERFTINASYSHVFVKDAPINVVPGNPNFNPLSPATYVGKARSHVDIVSLGLTSTFGGPAAPVVAKY